MMKDVNYGFQFELKSQKENLHANVVKAKINE